VDFTSIASRVPSTLKVVYITYFYTVDSAHNLSNPLPWQSSAESGTRTEKLRNGWPFSFKNGWSSNPWQHYAMLLNPDHHACAHMHSSPVVWSIHTYFSSKMSAVAVFTMYVEQVSFIQYAMIDILPFFTLNKQQQ
jgi:hypothetical protein